jgi:hypothetical protein
MSAPCSLSFPSLSGLDRRNTYMLQLQPSAAGDTVELAFTAEQVGADCPNCGQSSRRVHSRYTRTVADLPWQTQAVRLRLHVRRLFCATPDCPRTIFGERLPSLTERYARTTLRLCDAHRSIGFTVGGEAGSRLAQRLHMPTSCAGPKSDRSFSQIIGVRIPGC